MTKLIITPRKRPYTGFQCLVPLGRGRGKALVTGETEAECRDNAQRRLAPRQLSPDQRATAVARDAEHAAYLASPVGKAQIKAQERAAAHAGLNDEDSRIDFDGGQF